MKTPVERLDDLQQKLRKMREWIDDFKLRLEQNSALRAALNLSKPKDRARLDELLVEEDGLKQEFKLLQEAHDEIIKEVDELLAPYRMKLN